MTILVLDFSKPQFWQTVGTSKVASHGGQKLCGALCCSGAEALQDHARDLAGGHRQAHASLRGESLGGGLSHATLLGLLPKSLRLQLKAVKQSLQQAQGGITEQQAVWLGDARHLGHGRAMTMGP